jgi:hypothetical protein
VPFEPPPPVSAVVQAEPRVVVEPAPAVPPLAFGTFDAPAVRAADDDEDEDDEDSFVPPFDLLEALSRGGLQEGSAELATAVALEVVRCQLDRVVAVRHPRTKGRLRLDSGPPIGAFEGADVFALRLDACRVSAVREGGRSLTEAEVQAKHDGATMRITRGMRVSAHVEGGDELLIYWVPRAEALPLPGLSLRPTREHARSGAMSVALHVALLALIGIVWLGDKKADVEVNAGRFATVDMKDLELEAPPPTPPPQPTSDVPEAPAPAAPLRPEPASKNTRLPMVKGVRTAAQPASPSSQAAQRILSALGGVPTSTSTISVSNLDALPVGAGDFKVSGALGKAPGETLRVAAGGNSEPDTKSASELGGSSLGKVQARAGSGNVRARVTAAPQAIRGEGTLDRSEIQKVVNAHLYQIQGCYERQLAKDPSLSGKIFFDWVVGLSGTVSSVRVGRSTIQSIDVTTCIQSVIQGWKFPSPQGGTVTVTYPFAFSSFGG